MRSLQKLFLFGLISLTCTCQLFLNTAEAQNSDAIRLPLPSRFFSEKTMLLARVNVEHANVERVFQTIDALVPEDIVSRTQAQQQKSFSGGPPPTSGMIAMATMRQLADNPSIVDQLKRQRPNEPLSQVDVAAARLLSADINALYVVLMQAEESSSMPAMYFLCTRESFQGDADEGARKSAFSEAAGLLNAKVVTDGKWFVASTNQLPENGDDFGLDEEVFLDALRSNPLHDFMVAFVPTEEMRKTAREGWDQAMKNSPPEEKQFLPLAENLIQVLDGDWFYMSVQLGEDPAVRLSAHFANTQKPKTLSRAFQQLMSALPKAIKIEPSSNPTIQKIRQANAKVQLQLFQVLQFEAEDAFLVCDLNEDTLVSFLNKMLELQDEPVDNSPSSIDPTANYDK